MKKYKVGEVIKGIVTGIENYGIFVNINNEYTGLIHISEISSGFVKNVSDYVNLNEEITAKIIEIDDEQKKLKLSIKDFEKNSIDESINGFSPLAEKLPIWIEEKLKQFNNE